MKIELAHDILAKKIYEMASAEDKMLYKIRSFISNRYGYYKDASVLLDQNALDYISPYIHKINLEKEELDFIQKSKSKASFRQFAISLAIIVIFFILLVSGFQAAMTFKDLYYRDVASREQLKTIKAKEKERADAELRAQNLLAQISILNPTDIKDTNLVKQLIIQYDTLKKQQIQLSLERDLAQSATLSDLAETAFEQDEIYALRLAAKAWELNKQNKQALKVFEKFDDEKKSFSSLSEADIQQFIAKKTSKGLSDNELRAIFSEENTIVQKTRTSPKTNIKDEIKICSKKIANEPDIQQIIANPVLLQEQYLPKTVPSQKIVKPNIKLPNSNNKHTNLAMVGGDANCIQINQLIGEQIAIQDSRGKEFYFSYSKDGKLSFEFSLDIKGNTYDELMLHLKNGITQTVRLTHKTNLLGKTIYFVEMGDEVEKLIQKQIVTNFTFSVKKNKSYTKKLTLSPEVQTQFLNLSKCLL